MRKEKEIWKPLNYRNVLKGRYLISSKGRVKMLWRLNTNGKKRYFDYDKYSKTYPCPSKTSAMVGLVIDKNKVKSFFIHSIMIKIFKIKKPNDPYNQYVPFFKDGNILNNDRNNIGFKKFTQYKINGFKHDPINIVEKGKLIAKVCGKCGKQKTQDHFMPSTINIKGIQTLKNKCVECSSRERWKKIKSNPKLYKAYKKQQKKWNNSEKGRKYMREWGRLNTKNLGDSYIKKVITCRTTLKNGDIPKDLVKMYRDKVKTHRHLHNLKTNI